MPLASKCVALGRIMKYNLPFPEEIVFMGGGVGIGNRSAAAGKSKHVFIYPEIIMALSRIQHPL